MRVGVVESPTYCKQLVKAVESCGHSIVLFRGKPTSIFRGTDLAPSTLALVSAIVECDLASDDALVTAIRELPHSLRIDSLIGIHDLVIERVARVAKTLGFSFSDPDGITRARNKLGMRDLLLSSGVSHVRAHWVSDLNSLSLAISQTGFPCVLKPVRGSASLSVLILKEPEGIEHIWKRINESFAAWPDGIECIVSGDLLLEPYLKGPLVSLEVSRSQNVTRLLSVSWRFRASHDESLEIGTLMPAPCTDDLLQQLMHFVGSVVDTAQLDRGIFHIEAILTEHGPELIEINPRLMGGSLPLLFERSFGLNIFDPLVSIYLHDSSFVLPAKHHAYSVSCFFGALDNGVMPDKIDVDFLSRYQSKNPEIKFFVSPGERYRILDSNYSYIGRFILTDTDVLGLFNARDEILSILEKSLGFNVTRPEPGYGL